MSETKFRWNVGEGTVEINAFRVTFDPTGTYQSIATARLFNACGLLIHWAVEPAREGLNSMELIRALYQLGGGPLKGFKMAGDGTLTFGAGGEDPDPPLAPLVQVDRPDGEIFIYEHAWVAFRKPTGEFEVERMD